MTEKKPKILLIGPLPIEGDVIGGTKVNFAEMVRQFRMRGNFDTDVINISRNFGNKGKLGRLFLNVRALLGVLGKILSKRKQVNVVLLNVSPDSTRLAVPLIWLVCKLAGLPLGLRFFGGNFGRVFDASSRWLRGLARRTFLKSPLVLMQTQALVERFRHFPGVSWFPNTRDLPEQKRSHPSVPQKFLFLAQLRADKGFREAIEAVGQLENGSLDLYGPLIRKEDAQFFETAPRAQWHGPLKSDEVPAILSSYDLLLFPSYFTGEGYPGVILEAMQCGTPVIATRWMDIPEVLGDETGGVLVEPRDVSGLTHAIKRLQEDPEAYAALVAGAWERGAFFRSEKWYSELENKLMVLLNPHS